jgi:hypothetical protein
MPKELKQKVKHIHNYPQSLKKTHCMKTYNYYNQKQSEFLTIRPEQHWTENPNHIFWEYYILVCNQINIATIQFKETRNWDHWYNFQRNQHILKTLVNDSVNLTLLDPVQVRTLNETTRKNFEPTGKTT